MNEYVDPVRQKLRTYDRRFDLSSHVINHTEYFLGTLTRVEGDLAHQHPLGREEESQFDKSSYFVLQ